MSAIIACQVHGKNNVINKPIADNVKTQEIGCNRIIDCFWRKKPWENWEYRENQENRENYKNRNFLHFTEQFAEQFVDNNY